MILAAVTAGAPRTTLSFGVRIWPPAESTIELNHTVSPSYCAPCSSM